MELFNFTTAIKDLCDYYDRKEPKPGTLDIWFREVKHIPAEALGWICKQIYQTNEAFPRNLPGIIKFFYQQWKDTHPEKIINHHVDCPDCDDGTIRAWKIGDNGRSYSYLFRCGRCRQSTVQAWPIAIRAQLTAQGYEPEPKNKVVGPSTHGTLQGIVSQVADNLSIPVSADDIPF